MAEQLRKAVQEDPNNVNVHKMLSEIYARQGQYDQAEKHLADCFWYRPGTFIAARQSFSLRLKRSEDQISTHLATANKSFESRLMADPNDVEARIGSAEILLLSRQPDRAESLLREGLALQDDEQLRMALSGLYSGVAVTRLKESALNRDLAVRLAMQAMSVHAKNPVVTQLVIQLIESGAKFSEEDLKPLVTLWAEKCNSPDSTDSDELVLTQLLASSGKTDEAINRMQLLAEKNPNLRDMLARLYRIAGQDTQADDLLDSLIAERILIVEENPEEFDALFLYAQTLLLAKKYSDARTVLRPWIDRDTDDENQKRARSTFLAASILLYDTIIDSQVPVENAPSKTDLLREILNLESSSQPAIRRLAQLSCSTDELAAEADKMLVEVMAQPFSSETIYNFIGTCALEANQIAKARKYLERAYGQSDSNPMILNNLALALVRGSDDSNDLKRALELTERALEVLPDNPEVLSTRAEVLISQEEWESARADLETALPKRPNSRNARQLLVKVYDALDEPGLADEHRRILAELE